MGDLNQLQGPLPDGTAPQIGNAILGDDDIRHVPGDGDHRAGRENGLDLGDAAALGGGGHGNDAPPALGVLGAEGKIKGAAGAGELGRADGFGADLAGQVDLNGGVDGHKVVDLGDHSGVVGVGSLAEKHVGGGGHNIVELLVAHDEGADVLALVDVLVLAGDDARLDQVANDGGKQLGVEAQLLLLKEGVAHGVRHTAQAQLDAVPVVDEVRNVTADDFVRLGGGAAHIVGGDGIIHLHDHVHLVNGDGQAAGELGQLGVDLQNHLLRMLVAALLPHTAAGNRKGAVLVHGGGHGDKLVDHGLIFRPALHHVVQVGGQMGGKPQFVGLSHHGAVQVADHFHLALQLRHGHKGIGNLRPPALQQLDVIQLRGDPVKVFIKADRFADLTAGADHVTTSDHGQFVLNRAQLCPVLFLIRQINQILSIRRCK